MSPSSDSPKMVTRVFVGGPLHGRAAQVRDDVERVMTAKATVQPMSIDGAPFVAAMPESLILYELKRPVGGSVLMFVAESVARSEVMARSAVEALAIYAGLTDA